MAEALVKVETVQGSSTSAFFRNPYTEADIAMLKERYKCPHFRILVIGQANSGKTTILQAVCGVHHGTTPIIYDQNGRQLVPSESHLTPSLERGLHDIEHQITYPGSNFIFHDSEGFEAGASEELEEVWEFIEKRSLAIELKDQLHAIWYCVPMDSSTHISDIELPFFEKGTGKVPLVVIFTKFDSQITLEFVKLNKNVGDRWSKARENAEEIFQRVFLPEILNTKYPPKAYVRLEDMDLTPSDCPEVTEVIEVTAEVIVSAFLHLDPTSSHGKLECIQLIDQFRKPITSPNAGIEKWGLTDGYKVITAFGLPSAGKNAFLNLIFSTNLGTRDVELVQGIWLCGAKDANIVIMNVEDRHWKMMYTMERKCALLSFIFSDVLVFHVTTTQYGHLIRFILAIFELAIGFLQKEAKWSIGRSLLLFVITANHSDVSTSEVQSVLTTEIEQIWAEQSKSRGLADQQLYDHFDVSFMVVPAELCQPQWKKADIADSKARFFDKGRADYAFKPEYQKKIPAERFGLCMERLWLELEKDYFDLSIIKGLIESFHRDEVPPTVCSDKNN